MYINDINKKIFQYNFKNNFNYILKVQYLIVFFDQNIVYQVSVFF